MELAEIKDEAAEIAEQADEISVEYHREEDDGWWSVYFGFGGEEAAYYGVVDGTVLEELAGSYDVYDVAIYHRDGTPWN